MLDLTEISVTSPCQIEAERVYFLSLITTALTRSVYVKEKPFIFLRTIDIIN